MMRVFIVLLSAVGGAVAQKYYAVAKMLPAQPIVRPISGTVTFEQDEPLGDMTVTYYIEGLSNGEHGFHVHQYGDTRVPYPASSATTTMAAHFVPFCPPPDIDDQGNVIGNDCENDQYHGFPPSIRRQPGDMGNITAVGNVAQGTIVLGQAKMSLVEALRSVVGRSVVVHANADDGTQPYGNAGSPMAYGVIGLGHPDAIDQSDNEAQAPTTPKVDKIACRFEDDGVNLVTGDALLTLLEPCDPADCTARMQAKLFGMEERSEHSFHFHQWGDLTVDITQAGALGEIYTSRGVSPSELRVLDESGEAQYEAVFSTDDLVQHVGRSLTVHQGASSSTPTIAAAACGLANPSSTLDTSAAPSTSGGASAGVVALCVIAVLVAASVLSVGTLYYLRKPIPFCGSCIYDSDMIQVPPPPPKPVSMAVPPPPTPPPGVGKV